MVSLPNHDARRAEQNYLVVGLGNPGRAYKDTLHNAGREVAEQLAAKRGAKFVETSDAFVAKIAEGVIMLPNTFMNLSGEAVGPYVRKRAIALQNIIVLVDDVYTLTGKIRVRPGGAPAGHNGLKSINDVLESSEYPRIKIGIGPDPGGEFRTDYVLSRPRPEVMAELFQGKATALIALETILDKGLAAAMEIFNA